MCGVTAPIIPKVKEYIKGSSTILIINQDYSTENFQEGFRRPRDFYEAIKVADFIFNQDPSATKFMNFLLKVHMKLKKKAWLVPHPVDTQLKDFKIDYDQRIDNIGVIYHRYRNELLIPSMISWGLKYPTILFGLARGNIPIGLFHYTAPMLPWAKYFYQLAHCLPPETVISGKIFKPISTIREGDLVFGHDGTLHKVTKTFKRDYEGKMLVLDLVGLPPLRLTPEHPLLVYRPRRDSRGIIKPNWKYFSRYKKRPKPKWIPANYVKPEDFVAVPVIHTREEKIDFLTTPGDSKFPPIKIKLDEEFLWFLGIYIADGGSRGTYINEITFSADQSSDVCRATRVLESLGVIPKEKDYGTYIRLHFNSRRLNKWIRSNVGESSFTKHLPPWCWSLDSSQLKSLLKGIIIGDGAYLLGPRGHRHRDYISISTVSPSLAYQLFLVCTSLKLQLSLYLSKKKREGRFANAKPIYTIKLQGKKELETLGFNTYRKEETYHYSFFDKGWLWVKVRKVGQEFYKGKVFNLQVSRSQSYLAQTVSVHNCSLALDYVSLYHCLGRYPQETACLGTPTVTTNRIYMGQKLFPMVCHDPMDFEGLRSSLQKLIDNEEFYHEVADYAYEHVEEFNWKNSKSKLLKAIEEAGLSVG